MSGNEPIKVGDELQCWSNEGLMSVGDIKTIRGLTETHISFSNPPTIWERRDGVRWNCYQHIPKAELVEEAPQS